MTKFVWNEENTTALQSAVANKEVISQEDQKAIGEQLGTSGRSVGSKLRKLGFTNVAKAAEKAQLMTASEIAELEEILAANPGQYTYAEIAQVLAGGKFTTKQVQGKVLSLELTSSVKAAPKKEAVRSYTPAEEATFLEMAEAGASVEELAAALGRTIQQIRGKGSASAIHKRTSHITVVVAEKE
jgi:ribosomal protein L22